MSPPAPPPSDGLQAVTRPTAGKQSLQDSRAVLAAAARRVARLERDGVSVATGFLVGPALLLTAGHAVRLDVGATGPGPVAGMTAVFDHREGTGLPPAESGVRVRLAELLESSPPAVDDPPAPGLPTRLDGLDYALVRLDHHPPDLPDGDDGPGPRDFYPLRRDAYAFGSGVLNIFHHSLTWAPDHGQTVYDRLTADGRRIRYGGPNTLEGSSGGPVVSSGGHLVGLHHGFRGNGVRVNEAVPIGLIAERILAGPHACLVPRTRQPPSPSGPAPLDPVVAGAVAAGAAMGALLGPRRPYARVAGATGEPVRVATAREVAEWLRTGDRTGDPRHAPGVELVVEAARSAESVAGDGAVTAAVLAAALIEEAGRLRAAGTPPRELADTTAAALHRARTALTGAIRPCADPSAAARTATADRRLAEAVSAAALLAGPDDVLLCEPGVTRDVEPPVVRQGLRLPAGHASPHTARAAGNDPWTGQARLTDPYILLLGSTMGDGESFRRLRGRIGEAARPLLIVAGADGSDPRAGLLRSLCDPADGPVPTVVRLPAGPGRHLRLRALSVLTGATALTEDSGLLPGAAWFDVLGRADLALVSASETVLVGAEHDPAARERWTASSRVSRDMARSDTERAALDELLTWLSARSVTLRVGADTPEALALRTAAAERAARTARAALRSGTLRGGGEALLRARAALAPSPTTPRTPGATVVGAALAAPFRLLAGAAGLAPTEVDRLVLAAGFPPVTEGPDPATPKADRPVRTPGPPPATDDTNPGTTETHQLARTPGPPPATDDTAPAMSEAARDGDGPRDAAETVLVSLHSAATALESFLGMPLS
ncbi:TCP-1/cpn60 chaperonin family protein [Streptomyces sp. NPDC005486]|uniref:TCP-1/cpn60 chaperonin family protein n=1 Tax=Streptomyces sp. NPDC005486 TaxID=3155345 RepID=UPI0033A217FC